MYSILDYSVEGLENEHSFDETVLRTLKLIELKDRTINLSDDVTWNRKIERFEEIYKKAINNY